MIVSDSPDGGMRPISLKRGIVKGIVGLVVLAFCLIAGVAVYEWADGRMARTQEEELQKQIDAMKEENGQLVAENLELSEKISLLSDSVTKNEENKKAQEEEEKEKRIPKGFPLAGTAVIVSSSETNNGEGTGTQGEENGQDMAPWLAENEPIVVFSSSQGVEVIAAAQGKVASVEDDAIFGHRVTVDHENGYVSVYRTQSEPKVSEGDEVGQNTALYEIQSQEERLGYQIMQDGAYVDPMKLLEVYG